MTPKTPPSDLKGLAEYHAARDIPSNEEEEDALFLPLGALPKPPDNFTIEAHGPKGHYALYHGRSKYYHGYNLAHLTEVDEETRKILVRALNYWVKSGRP